MRRTRTIALRQFGRSNSLGSSRMVGSRLARSSSTARPISSRQAADKTTRKSASVTSLRRHAPGAGITSPNTPSGRTVAPAALTLASVAGASVAGASVAGASVAGQADYRPRRRQAQRGPSGRIPADRAAQEIVAERREAGALAIVLAVAVAAGRRLVEQRVVAQRLQLGGHLARMPGMDAVVASAGRDQDRRIGLARRRHVIGRHRAEE